MDLPRTVLQRPLCRLHYRADEGIINPTPVEQNRERFHQFRKDIVELNQKLPAQRTARADVLSGPAETVLLKHVRERGFDPSALDITHIGRGSGLYLLELFVTAAQQEAYDDRSLLQPLLKEAAALGSLDQTAARERLRAPLLMVSLWDNQEDGLQQWQENDREGILEMATATGKTVAGIAAIADICGAFPGHQTPPNPTTLAFSSLPTQMRSSNNGSVKFKRNSGSPCPHMTRETRPQM